MISYLLDTNAWIRVLNGSSEALVRRLRATPRSQIRISSIVKAELLFGARRSKRVAENLRVLDELFETVVSVPFDDACAAEYARIRLELEQSGKPIGPNDCLIAATARAHRFVLVTHNTREFSRVPELRLEDWES